MRGKPSNPCEIAGGGGGGGGAGWGFNAFDAQLKP